MTATPSLILRHIVAHPKTVTRHQNLDKLRSQKTFATVPLWERATQNFNTEG